MSRKRDFLEYLQEDEGGLSVIPNAQSQPLFEAFKKYKEVYLNFTAVEIIIAVIDIHNLGIQLSNADQRERNAFKD